MLRIPQRHVDKMIRDARARSPKEACGLLAGHADGTDDVVDAVFPLTNADDSTTHFSLDAREQLDTVVRMREMGLVPLGNYHSHPRSPARPSDEDRRLAFDRGAYYLIVSLEGTRPIVRAYHLEDDGLVERPIETCET